jgi:Rieske [2Fe-2S] domain
VISHHSHADVTKTFPSPEETMSLTFAFTVDDLADGQARQMPAAPHIVVYRVGNDFYATQDSCSHEQWSLGEDGELECSVHCTWPGWSEPSVAPVETSWWTWTLTT